jgi:hypothetical protein
LFLSLKIMPRFATATSGGDSEEGRSTMKARRKSKSAAPAETADHGPPERARHGALAPRDTAIPGVTGRRVKHECRLDWYWEKCSITDRQHAAGLRFRRDWLLAASPPKVTGRYSPKLPMRHDATELQLAARQRVAKAAAALGPDLLRVLIDVCCFDAWAAERLPRLRDGLRLLADRYGMPKE